MLRQKLTLGALTNAHTRLLLRAMLRYRPILQIGRRFPGITVISRRADVLEVFARDREFSVAHYGVRFKATTGAFLLGMPDDAAYRRDLNIFRAVVLRSDVERIHALAAEASREYLARAIEHKTTIDLKSDLCDPVALRYLADYYGIPDPGHGRLLRWFTMQSFYLFGLFLLTGPRVEIPAIRASEELLAYIEGLVSRRRASGEPGRDDVMGRMIALRSEASSLLSDREIASQLIGFISGGLIAPFVLAMNVFDRVLDLPPEQLDGLRQAARHNEDEVAREYVLEAARLAPFPGLVWRYCESDAVIASGTDHERSIPARTLVCLFITAANVDPHAISDPHTFRVGRPPDEMLLFGHNLHRCPASDVGVGLITQMLKTLAAEPVFQRVPNRDGSLQYGPKWEFPEGGFPARLVAQMRS